MSVKATGQAWLRSVLTGDATLMGLVAGAWPANLVPSSASGVYVTYQFISDVPLRVVGPRIFWRDDLFDVKVVGPASQYGRIVAAARRVHELLEARQEGPVVVCELERELEVPADIFGGEIYENITSRWRMKIQEDN